MRVCVATNLKIHLHVPQNKVDFWVSSDFTGEWTSFSGEICTHNLLPESYPSFLGEYSGCKDGDSRTRTSTSQKIDLWVCVPVTLRLGLNAWTPSQFGSGETPLLWFWLLCCEVILWRIKTLSWLNLSRLSTHKSYPIFYVAMLCYDHWQSLEKWWLHCCDQWQCGCQLAWTN